MRGWRRRRGASAGPAPSLRSPATIWHSSASPTLRPGRKGDRAFSGQTLSPADIAPGSAVTLRLGAREADGRFPAAATPRSCSRRIRWRSTARSRASAATAGEHFPCSASGSSSAAGARLLGTRASQSVRSAARTNSGRDKSRVSLTATKASTRGLAGAPCDELGAVGRHRRRADGTEPGRGPGIRGTVLAVSDSAWTIDDPDVPGAAPRSVLLGNPGLGDFVEVRFRFDGDGAVADRIQKEDAADDELDFSRDRRGNGRQRLDHLGTRRERQRVHHRSAAIRGSAISSRSAPIGLPTARSRRRTSTARTTRMRRRARVGGVVESISTVLLNHRRGPHRSRERADIDVRLGPGRRSRRGAGGPRRQWTAHRDTDQDRGRGRRR